jgi:hypothetical protein
MDNKMFDYDKTAIRERVPKSVLDRFVNEARVEFAMDDMLMELHVIRAIRAYSASRVSKKAEAS